MQDGDVLLLENTRFHKGEEKNDPAFVAGARQARRPLRQRRLLRRPPRPRLDRGPRPSSCRPMPAARCRPSSRRWRPRSAHPKRPVVAIVGGAKVSSKIDVLEHLVDKVDALVIGGGMANTFLLAKGIAIGKSLAEPDLADTARTHHRRRRQGRLHDRPARRRGRRQGIQGRRRQARPSPSTRSRPTR